MNVITIFFNMYIALQAYLCNNLKRFTYSFNMLTVSDKKCYITMYNNSNKCTMSYKNISYKRKFATGLADIV